MDFDVNTMLNKSSYCHSLPSCLKRFRKTSSNELPECRCIVVPLKMGFRTRELNGSDYGRINGTAMTVRIESKLLLDIA